MTFIEVLEITDAQAREFEETFHLPFGFLNRAVSDISLSTLPLSDTSNLNMTEVTADELEILSGMRKIPEEKRDALMVLLRLVAYMKSKE